MMKTNHKKWLWLTAGLMVWGGGLAEVEATPNRTLEQTREQEQTLRVIRDVDGQVQLRVQIDHDWTRSTTTSRTSRPNGRSLTQNTQENEDFTLRVDFD